MDTLIRKKRFEQWREGYAASERTLSDHYLTAWEAHAADSPMLREAYAHAAMYASAKLDIYPGEALIGRLPFDEPVFFNYGSGTIVRKDMAEKLMAQRGMDAGERAEYVKRLERVRAASYIPANPAEYSDAENRSIRAHAATSTWFGGHMVIDYARALEIGLDGYAKDIAHMRGLRPEKAEFYEALSVLLGAIQSLIERYAALAKELSSAEGYDAAQMTETADRLSRIAHEPPRCFSDALQLYWMLHMLNGADTFGRLDYNLAPYVARDIESGALTREQLEQWVCELCLKIEFVEQIQNMTIGGTDGAGEDAYSPLTGVILEVVRALGYKGPNLCLRITPTMPEDIWEKALACLATGIGLPALYNDGMYVNSLVLSGVPLELARGYCLAGCSQLMVPGMSNFFNDIGMFNAFKVCEIAMHGGIDPRSGEMVGLPTKPAREAQSFEELMAIFYEQMAYFVDLEVTMHEKEAAYRHRTEGYVMRTLFMRDCIATGLDIFGGGARYQNCELEIIGITNCADHLHAIRQAVFEEKRVTMAELMDALDSNFEGRRDLREYLYNHCDKFGNDCEAVDRLRGEITEYLYAAFNERPGPLGGVFVPGEVIFTAHDHCGAAVGASADGRYAGTVLADSAGASQGRDTQGPTALMNSLMHLPVHKYLLTSTVLNLRFLPHMFKKEMDRKQIRLLLGSFITHGGMQMQINVCDAETLKQAQLHPEEYRNLVVRVGGYSDYFSRLPKALQDEIITRTAQEVG